MIKCALFKKCVPSLFIHFAPIFRAICEYHADKNLPLCCKTFVKTFFQIFVRIKALLGKCETYRRKQEVIGRSQVHGVELPN